jgi:sporulation protein YlmC with PRC-barrel domain
MGGLMSMKVSRIYGMDIYTDSGKFLGRVQDVLMDLEQGKIIRLVMEPLSNISREEAKRVLRERSVLYSSVKNIEDVVVVGKAGLGVAME